MAAVPAAVGTLLFSDLLQDSPLFRSKVNELDGNLERLKERASKLTKASKKYSGVLDSTSLGTSAFADSLEAFCGEATDEESSLIGGPTLLKFVSTFRELASFQDLLRTQTEVVLCERLNHDFIKVTSEVRDSKKRLDKRSSEYDAARLKHLGHRSAGHLSTWTGKSSDPDKSFADLLSAKSAADEARFEVARRFTEMESNKRFEFLESAVTAVDAHLRFFERGYQLFSNLEPYLQHALQLIEKLKADGEAQKARMEGLIMQHKAEANARDSMVGEAAAASRDAPTPVRPSGPLQMSTGTSQLASEMDAYIRQTQESKGQQITVLKQGYLLKQTSDFRKAWKRRFFVLDSQGMLYYYSTKEGSRKEQAPRNTCSLLTATIKPDAEDPSLRYAFRVVSPGKEYVLQAENEVEQQEWMQMLQGVIACLLTGGVDHDSIPTRPVRPTHSRTISAEITALSMGETPLGSGPAALSASASGRLTADGEQASPSLPSISERGSPGAGHPVSMASPATAAMQGAAGVQLARGGLGSAAAMGGGGGSSSSLASAVGGGVRPGTSGSSRGGGSTLEVLRQVPGNGECCDCGAADPDWASLNLGVLMCIECSGVHRRLGVHISKVRSCTLDTRVWEPSVVGLFQELGNEFANSVWEGGAAEEGSRPAALNPWSADSDDDSEEDQAFGAAARRRSSADAGPRRPGPSAPLTDKERWIAAKYVEKRQVACPAGARGAQHLQDWLWDAVMRGDIKSAYRAVACGADVNHSYSSQPAAQLVWEANMQCGGGADQPLSPTNLGHISVLHAACRGGDLLMAELLLQSGAQIDAVEVMRRSPLMYCLLYDQPEAAKLLLRRGAASTRDRHGLTAAQLAQGRPCSSDSELMALLSRQP